MNEVEQGHTIYAHALLSMAGMYGPLSTIAKNINIFLSENNYLSTEKNDLKQISDECDQQVHLMNHLVFDQKINDEDVFRNTWFIGLRKWEKARKHLQTNVEFLINYYDLDLGNEILAVNYGLLKDLPSEIPVNIILPKWALSIYGNDVGRDSSTT